MNAFDWDEYYKVFKHCPDCGNDSVTLPDSATNHASCKCGWQGPVDDLLSRQKELKGIHG